MNPHIHAVAVALGLPQRRDQPRRGKPKGRRSGNYGARALRQSHAAQFCERCECRFADEKRDGKGYDAWREQVPGTRVCCQCQREIEVGHIISANPIAEAGYLVRVSPATTADAADEDTLCERPRKPCPGYGKRRGKCEAQILAESELCRSCARHKRNGKERTR